MSLLRKLHDRTTINIILTMKTKEDCKFFLNGRCTEKKHGLLCPMLCREAVEKEKELKVLKWEHHFPGGRYAGQSVRDIFDIDRSYLGWTYYQWEEFSFEEEILSALNIIDRIAKPGKDWDKFQTWKEKNFTYEEIQQGAEQGGKRRMGRWSHWQKTLREQKRQRAKEYADDERRFCSAGRLAWKNQGH